MNNSDNIKKFKTLIFVKASLISLYLALTIPITYFSINELMFISIVIFLLGLFLIISITNDYVITCDNSISYKTNFLSSLVGKKSWEILWRDIKLIKSFPTSQGRNVHYFITSKGQSFLIPQRIEKLEEFVSIISIKTNLDTSKLKYLSPLWTYKFLTYLSFFMVIGEIISFLI